MPRADKLAQRGAPEPPGFARLVALHAVADAADGRKVGVGELRVVEGKQRSALEGGPLGERQRLRAVRARVQT